MKAAFARSLLQYRLSREVGDCSFILVVQILATKQPDAQLFELSRRDLTSSLKLPDYLEQLTQHESVRQTGPRYPSNEAYILLCGLSLMATNSMAIAPCDDKPSKRYLFGG